MNYFDTAMLATQPAQSLSQYQNITANPTTAALAKGQAMPEKNISMPSLQDLPLLSGSDTGRKKPPKTVEIPIFIRKTYHMVNVSDSSIVSWSKDGKSFIIRDVDSFSSTIIPQFYNHKNFKSFVRQLNFYGFRKVKSDRIRKDADLDKLEAKHWQFRHDYFKKGRSDLLEEIQKSKHNAVASQEEVDSLKNEVKELKACIAVMAANMGKLTSFVETAAVKRPAVTEIAENDPSTPRKRRRAEEVAALSSPVAPQTYEPVSPVPQVSAPPSPSLSGFPASYGCVDQVTIAPLNDTYNPGTIMPAKKSERMASFSSIGSLNQDFLELFEDDLDEFHGEQIQNNPGHDQELWARLNGSFSAVPMEAQELFVQHIDEAAASPNNLHHLTDILSTPSTNDKDQVKVVEGYSPPSVIPLEG